MSVLTVYESDDTTLVSDLAVTNLDAAADSDVLTVHVWNDKGNAAAQTVTNIMMQLYSESPTGSGTYVSEGVPPQDERWGRYRVVGYDNTGDSAWSTPSTDWVSVGAFSGLPVASIPGDCAIYLEIKFHPPASADELQWRWNIKAWHTDRAISLPAATSRQIMGIETGVGDYSNSHIVSGGAVTATGTPDDEVHVAAMHWVYQGKFYGSIVEDVTLNQDDGSAATLVATESYWAALTAGAGSVTTTKGDKAVAPVKPTPAAGEPFIKWVLVEYDTPNSKIETGDISGTPDWGRHNLTYTSGLTVDLHPGTIIGNGSYRYSHDVQTLTVTASSTNRIWSTEAGLPEVTTTAAFPSSGSLGEMFDVVTDGSSVTSIVDKRQYAGQRDIIAITCDLSGGTGADKGFAGVPFDRAYIEKILVVWSDNGGGSADDTVIDINLDGTTIYTGQGTEDNRPTLAWNATDLETEHEYHEVTEIRMGSRLSVDLEEDPTGGTPASCIVYLILARG